MSQLLSDLECSGRGQSVTPGSFQPNSEPRAMRLPLTGGGASRHYRYTKQKVFDCWLSAVLGPGYMGLLKGPQ
ncbi:hypothetical protein QQF64_019253 [Cirrhinus molitorella]|uniref:Uncharacterized protein n=1 Tax=Cirrhinus molitorella TaxID=172907 RepID=A0ABR3LIH8_9TELE